MNSIWRAQIVCTGCMRYRRRDANVSKVIIISDKRQKSRYCRSAMRRGRAILSCIGRVCATWSATCTYAAPACERITIISLHTLCSLPDSVRAVHAAWWGRRLNVIERPRRAMVEYCSATGPRGCHGSFRACKSDFHCWRWELTAHNINLTPQSAGDYE